jgi:CO/xanthine dehydrogenase FAD-binding subunit
VGVAGVGGLARRARAVEQSRNPDDVLKDVELADDAVASAEYRRQVLPLLVRQALEELENA